MKKCSTCKEEKPESEFYRKNKKRTQSICKPCFNAYCAERWRQRKLEAISYKGSLCTDCGKSFHYSVFEFHHLDPSQKEFNWTKMRLISKSRLKKELDKCILLCANCHRLRHAE